MFSVFLKMEEYFFSILENDIRNLILKHEPIYILTEKLILKKKIV
jgi:hypothetical protein